jgi:hypothetical protein
MLASHADELIGARRVRRFTLAARTPSQTVVPPGRYAEVGSQGLLAVRIRVGMAMGLGQDMADDVP